MLPRFLKQGWRIVTEVHTAHWIVVDVLGALVPPAILTATVDWVGEHSIAALAIVFVFALAATVLVALAVLGYRAEHQTRSALPPIEAVSASTMGPERMPIQELRKLAADSGWNLNIHTSGDASDLTNRLNQAAVDGTIRFWGRICEPERRESDAQTAPLVKICAAHFAEYRLYPVNLFGEEATNFMTFTSRNGMLMRELRGQTYQDIHADRGELVRWIDRNRK
jgi:hypothetical protein